jgi:hypothetical protein
LVPKYERVIESVAGPQLLKVWPTYDAEGILYEGGGLLILTDGVGVTEGI